MEVPTWQGLYVSAKVPQALRARLATDIAAAVARPEMRAEFDRRMLVIEGASAQDLAMTMTRELAVWAAVVDQYKLTAD